MTYALTMPSKITNYKKLQLIKLLANGVSHSKISKQLRMSISQVYRYSLEFEKGSILNKKPHKGREPILKEKDFNKLYKSGTKNPFSSSLDIVKKSGLGKLSNSSPTTRKKYLNKVGLKSRTAAIKPHLSDKNVERRLELCDFFFKKPYEYFENIIYSDEC